MDFSKFVNQNEEIISQNILKLRQINTQKVPFGSFFNEIQKMSLFKSYKIVTKR